MSEDEMLSWADALAEEEAIYKNLCARKKAARQREAAYWDCGDVLIDGMLDFRPLTSRKITLRLRRAMSETKKFKRINKYTCRECGKSIITFAKDYGTTPMMLNCRATVDCGGMMQSMMHMVNQSLKPDFEWYKPKGKVKDQTMREHVAMGGLMIRPYMKLSKQN